MADADATIGWDNRDFKRGAREATKTLNKFEGGFSKSFKSIGKLAGPALAVGGLAKWGSAIFEGTLRLEELTVSLKTVSDGTESLDDQLTALRKTAKLPGLGFEEAIEGSVRLQAAGISASQSRETIEAFGNALASAGKGKADLDGVILALTQIAAKGKISAEEINQIGERVPQLRAVMKETFGTAVAEDIQKLGVSAEEFISKTVGALGNLERAGSTARNEIENAKDSVAQLNMALGEKLGAASVTGGVAAFWGDVAADLATAIEGKELNFEDFVKKGSGASAKIAAKKEIQELLKEANQAFKDGNLELEKSLDKRRRFLEEGLLNFNSFFRDTKQGLIDEDKEKEKEASPENDPEARLQKWIAKMEEARELAAALKLEIGEAEFNVAADPEKLAKLKADLAGVLEGEGVLNTDELRAVIAGAEASGDALGLVTALEALKASLPITKEIEAVSKRIAETEARKWDDALEKGKEAADMQKEAEDASNEARERDAILAKKREEFDLEQQILAARAAGMKDEADELQKALDLRRDAESIARDLGVSEAEAMALAKETAGFKKDINDLEKDRTAAESDAAARSKIFKKGEDEKRLTRKSFQGLDGPKEFSGLDGLTKLQERVGNKGLLDKVANDVGSENKKPAGKAKDPVLSVAEKQLIASERTAVAIENLTAE